MSNYKAKFKRYCGKLVLATFEADNNSEAIDKTESKRVSLELRYKEDVSLISLHRIDLVLIEGDCDV
jgi:hypothetical protein